MEIRIIWPRIAVVNTPDFKHFKRNAVVSVRPSARELLFKINRLKLEARVVSTRRPSPGSSGNCRMYPRPSPGDSLIATLEGRVTLQLQSAETDESIVRTGARSPGGLRPSPGAGAATCTYVHFPPRAVEAVVQPSAD